ncbi:MAG TPA: PfkB family carbohydrate kinase [Streptosporangiaceae bacterium]|jgi:sugar/nucleoside kinase (ribokinase family)
MTLTGVLDLTTEPTKRYSVTIIGDIRIEFRTRLAERPFRRLGPNYLEFAPIETVIAGTAINFGRQATRYFRDIHIISRIGEDEFHNLINAALEDAAATSTLATTENQRNGVTLLIRDSEGCRVIVSGTPTPIAQLSAADVKAAQEHIATAHVLFTDGYLLLNPVSHRAVLQAAEIARAHSVLFCLDLVPHDMQRYMRLRDLRPAIDSTDIVMGSARTLAELVDLPAPYPYPIDLLPELARRLESIAGRTIWFLRLGDRDMEEVGACKDGAVYSHYYTGYAKYRAIAGFGDRVAALELYDLLSANIQKAEEVNLKEAQTFPRDSPIS